ncbi:MAG TPA: sigma-70 family RNA polymerase sigma factor [Polyangiaceae bacterium]|nr:sigma-70 family RNA polymerase sigma factor [Polyangiaceae bacterium]
MASGPVLAVDAADSPEVLQRVHAGLKIVDQVARRLARALGGALELEDLSSYGRLGLLTAARRFEPSRGVPFEAYAGFLVRGAVLDAVRGMALPRRTYERLRAMEAASRLSEGLMESTFFGAPAPSMAQKRAEAEAAMATAMALGVMADVAAQTDGELISVERSDPEQELSNAQRRALVLRLVAELPREEAELIRRHYLEDERFDEVARDLKISKSWASRLHARAISRLSRQVQAAL